MMTGTPATAAVGLRVLTVFMGIFLLLMGMNKLAWFNDSSELVWQLQQWQELTSGLSRRYIDSVALPGASVFARLVPLGELAAGIALMVGFRVRLVAVVALLMVCNFHFASGIVFTAGYFTNGYGPPVIGALLALACGGRRLPWSLRG